MSAVGLDEDRKQTEVWVRRAVEVLAMQRRAGRLGERARGCIRHERPDWPWLAWDGRFTTPLLCCMRVHRGCDHGKRLLPACGTLCKIFHLLEL